MEDFGGGRGAMRVQQRRLVGAVYSEEIAVVVRGDATTTMMRWTDGAYAPIQYITLTYRPSPIW
jgi:hypothetical protein